MKQKEEGITMITLVVMTILIIIIAGVTIYEFTDNDVTTEIQKDMQTQHDYSVNEAVKMNSTYSNQLEDWGL